jgi:putative phosphoesterase
MKIMIISDIHDNLINLKKCLDWGALNKVEILICCGDVTDSDTIKMLATKFAGPVYLIRGNMDIYEELILKKYPSIVYLGRSGVMPIAGHMVGICHEPEFIGSIIADKKAQIIFYGHTHKPWIAEREGIKIVNPGTLGGVFSKASFAFWDTESGRLELKILELL